MIGMELLQLLQGDPLAQMRVGASPNPNPQMAPQPQPQPQPPQAAPPQLRSLPPGGSMPPGSMPSPAQGGPPMGGGMIRPATPAELRGAQMSPPPQGAPPGPQAAPPPPNPLPQSGPPSVASQSPPDLVNLYMKLMQQQRSGSAIDHGLALMASSYAAPGTEGQIMHSMDNQQQDPSAMMGNLVQLENMQRLNAARPALIAGLTGGGQGGQNAMGLPNIDPNVLNAMSNDQLQKFYSDQVAGQIQAQTKLRDDVVQGR